MTDYLSVAFLLMGIGVVLLAAEFVLPTGGFMVIGGILCFVAAVGVVMANGTTQEAVIAVLALCVGVPAAGFAMFSAWKRFALKGGLDSDAADATVAAAPGVAELDRLKGRFGRTVTPMRPAGTVEFDGRRVDALSEGMMLAAGVWVRCVDARAGRVVVRQVDQPGDLAEMDLGDLK